MRWAPGGCVALEQWRAGTGLGLGKGGPTLLVDGSVQLSRSAQAEVQVVIPGRSTTFVDGTMSRWARRIALSLLQDATSEALYVDVPPLCGDGFGLRCRLRLDNLRFLASWVRAKYRERLLLLTRLRLKLELPSIRGNDAGSTRSLDPWGHALLERCRQGQVVSAMMGASCRGREHVWCCRCLHQGSRRNYI